MLTAPSPRARLARSDMEVAAAHARYDALRDAAEPEAPVWADADRAAWDVAQAETSLASWAAAYPAACAALGAANARAAELRRLGWHAAAIRQPRADAMRALNAVRASIRAAEKRLAAARAVLAALPAPIARIASAGPFWPGFVFSTAPRALAA